MTHKLGSIESIITWFKTAKPTPTVQDECCQLGCHLEEVDEMLDALITNSSDWKLERLAGVYKTVGMEESADYVKEINHTEMLDALCDQIVTAIGSATYLGYDILSALAEVDASNWSKYENGTPVYKPGTQKIAKGVNYKAPELKPFLGEKYGDQPHAED